MHERLYVLRCSTVCVHLLWHTKTHVLFTVPSAARREMLPLAKQQPPDPPEAPAPADKRAPWAAPASAGPGAARAEPPAAPPAGLGTAPAAPPPAGPSSAQNGVAAARHAPDTGVREPEAAGAAGAARAARAAAADAESVRRIPLDATRPGAGLAPEERALFHGGAVTRAKRDTGGVGARPGRAAHAARVPRVNAESIFSESLLRVVAPRVRSLILRNVVILLVNRVAVNTLGWTCYAHEPRPPSVSVRCAEAQLQLHHLCGSSGGGVLQGLSCSSLRVVGPSLSCAAQMTAVAAWTAASNVHSSPWRAFLA